MRKKEFLPMALAGLAAGTVAGLFGAGGGMVLVPLLSASASMKEEAVFPASVSIILPICVVTLICTGVMKGIDWRASLPYLPGSALGGWLAVTWGQKIPTCWLHRILGLFILWGGIRGLC